MNEDSADPPQTENVEDVEVVDGLPVLAEVQAVELTPAGGVPVVHAAVLAAGGFFAGALTMALVKRLAARKLAEAAVPISEPLGAWRPGTSRTYLVNVRLVSRPD